MLSSGVSEDLPLYLKSKYTVSNPIGHKTRPLTMLKPILRQGVSSDSPIFFQINHVGVVDDKVRKREISGNEECSERFLSNLKQNTLNFKPKFEYSDSQLSKFDYHSLKPSKIIDLIADKSPKIKNQTQFRIEFDKQLKKGFGISRGQFTL